MQTDLYHSYARFGFGRAPGDPAPADPRPWLASQLAGEAPVRPGATVADAFAALAEDKANPPAPGEKRRSGEIFRAEMAALQDEALTTDRPFRERLVWFWANHFTVSTRRGEIAPMIGDYVRSAIRPHVTGRFEDMLLAVMRHPAMLLYLDNAGSMGPDSLVGQRQGKGINENLARECLELHTLSPASGYTQGDVIQLARLLTGWTIDRREAAFRFRPQIHEPGDKVLLGRGFPEGEAGGVAALRFIAGHPWTLRHLATKLVRHFVADQPPADAVARMEGVLRQTGGDLRAASLELLRLPGAWTPLTKLRTPQELVLAAVRAAGLGPGRRPPITGIVAGLGQGMFNAPFPIGWPDTAAEWAGPEMMVRRVDWAYGFANRPELPEPAELAANALGPLLSADTADAIRRAGSRRDALTLVLGSPEFQRR